MWEKTSVSPTCPPASHLRIRILLNRHGVPLWRYIARLTAALPVRQHFMATPSLVTHGLRVPVVDDDLDEQFFAQFALEKVLPTGSPVQVAHNGQTAIVYMIGEGKFSDCTAYPFPSKRKAQTHERRAHTSTGAPSSISASPRTWNVTVVSSATPPAISARASLVSISR